MNYYRTHLSAEERCTVDAICSAKALEAESGIVTLPYDLTTGLAQILRAVAFRQVDAGRKCRHLVISGYGMADLADVNGTSRPSLAQFAADVASSKEAKADLLMADLKDLIRLANEGVDVSVVRSTCRCLLVAYDERQPDRPVFNQVELA